MSATKSSDIRFSDEEKEAVYRAIYQRRDMRHFLPDPLDEDLLQKLLGTMHAAPSVGFMQPWRILRIQDFSVRHSLKALVEEERQKTASLMDERQSEFLKLKIDGMDSCPELWVVCLMEERESHVFGRRTLPAMDLASVSCAIQNLWLAARTEGIGVGWVSFFDPDAVAGLLELPRGAEAVAILCLGKVERFYDKPLLESQRWAERGLLEDYVMTDRWDATKADRAQQQWRDRDDL